MTNEVDQIICRLNELIEEEVETKFEIADINEVIRQSELERADCERKIAELREKIARQLQKVQETIYIFHKSKYEKKPKI